MGDLDRAERELQEAVDLHRDIDAPAGEAHSLQRLAEVRLAQGDRAGAQRLLGRALPLARWSVIGKHLLQRIYGTMIVAAADPVAARAVVDQAEATLGETDACPLCAVMLAVPAAIACADAGDLTAARRHLAVAEASASAMGGKRLGGRRPGGAGAPRPRRGRRGRLPPAAGRGLPPVHGCRPAAGRGPVRARPGLAARPAPGARPGQVTARTAAASTR